MPPSGSPFARPTIRDLSRFLFSTPQCRTRCLSNLPPRHRRPSLSTLLPCSQRFLTTSYPHLARPKRSHDRGPPSTEDTQTDFSSLNVLGNTPAPSTSIDACAWDGFHLNSGAKVVGGKGVLLVNGEAFGWCPWFGGEGQGKRLVNGKGQFEVSEEAWGVLELVWPKPDLLILGVGKQMRPLSPKTRQHINNLGIRVDILDTRNAAAQFNLLATERGVGSVAAALIPLGWQEGIGVK